MCSEKRGRAHMPTCAWRCDCRREDAVPAQAAHSMPVQLCKHRRSLSCSAISEFAAGCCMHIKLQAFDSAPRPATFLVCNRLSLHVHPIPAATGPFKPCRGRSPFPHALHTVLADTTCTQSACNPAAGLIQAMSEHYTTSTCKARQPHPHL